MQSTLGYAKDGSLELDSGKGQTQSARGPGWQGIGNCNAGETRKGDLGDPGQYFQIS